MALPDFFLLGAPKAGTTALHVALARHPQLFLSRVKEPKFFLTDGPPPRGGGPGDEATYRSYVWRRADYEALFDPAPPGVRRGESTTLYLADSGAHRRIRALVPDARLIAVVRDPVDRAHSNWMHLRSAGLEPEADFVRACDLEDERMAAGWGPFWGYRRQGRYGAAVAHLRQLFAPEQVLVLVYRQVREDPRGTLDRVCAFLGVDTGVVSDLPAANVTAQVGTSRVDAAIAGLLRAGEPVTRRLPPGVRASVERTGQRALQRHQRTRAPLTSGQRAALIPDFLDDIGLLERLTGLSLDHWRDPGNSTGRPPLPGLSRVGTGHGDIDRPLC